MTRRRLMAALAVLGVLGACGSAPSARLMSVPGRPSAVVVHDGRVWVADDQRHAVYAMETSSEDPASEAPGAVGRNPVAIAAGRDAVWVAHADGTVVSIAAHNGRFSEPMEAGGSLTGVAVKGDRVWLADIENGSLIELDARSARVRRIYRIADGAVRVAVAGDVLWVTGRENSVTRVDPGSGDVGPTVGVGSGPIGLAYDGRRVWVANSDDGTVSRIDARTGKHVGDPVRVGGGPIGVAVAAGSVWVANQDDRTITRIDPDDGRVVGDPIELGSSPRGITAGDDAVWAVGTNPSALVSVEL